MITATNEKAVNKAKVLMNLRIIDYALHSVVSKTIIKKPTGKISAVSIDTDEELPEKTIPFDTLIQIIDGKAEIIIDGISNYLVTGQSIIIPAHASSILRAPERFKMISTIIKDGYND